MLLSLFFFFGLKKVSKKVRGGVRGGRWLEDHSYLSDRISAASRRFIRGSNPPL